MDRRQFLQSILGGLLAPILSKIPKRELSEETELIGTFDGVPLDIFTPETTTLPVTTTDTYSVYGAIRYWLEEQGLPVDNLTPEDLEYVVAKRFVNKGDLLFRHEFDPPATVQSGDTITFDWTLSG